MQQQGQMPPLSGVADATPSQGGNWFEIGQHQVRIVRLKHFPSSNPGSAGIPMVAIEGVILGSTVTPIGAERSQVIKCQGFSWKGDIKAFFMAICDAVNQPYETITDQSINAAFSGEGNSLAGIVLDLETWEKQTKTGGVWTVHKWSAPKQTPAADIPY
jgi:hypothetical protein